MKISTDGSSVYLNTAEYGVILPMTMKKFVNAVTRSAWNLKVGEYYLTSEITSTGARVKVSNETVLMYFNITSKDLNGLL